MDASPYTRLRAALLIGALISAAWLAAAYYYFKVLVGLPNLEALLPHELGIVVAGVFAPLAFLWLFLAFLRRGGGLRAHTALLREIGRASRRERVGQSV